MVIVYISVAESEIPLQFIQLNHELNLRNPAKFVTAELAGFGAIVVE